MKPIEPPCYVDAAGLAVRATVVGGDEGPGGALHLSPLEAGLTGASRRFAAGSKVWSQDFARESWERAVRRGWLVPDGETRTPTRVFVDGSGKCVAAVVLRRFNAQRIDGAGQDLTEGATVTSASLTRDSWEAATARGDLSGPVG